MFLIKLLIIFLFPSLQIFLVSFLIFIYYSLLIPVSRIIRFFFASFFTLTVFYNPHQTIIYIFCVYSYSNPTSQQAIYPNGRDYYRLDVFVLINDTLYVLSSGSLIRCTPPSIFFRLIFFSVRTITVSSSFLHKIMSFIFSKFTNCEAL